MNWLSGRGRGWGTALPGYWFPRDWRRAACGSSRKRLIADEHTLLVIDLGRRVKPCVSPDDPDRVMALLRERVPTG